jgi:ABC-type antimicrobial peptide transport system permease subunit
VPIVINQALARMYFPDENPVGRIVGGGIGADQRIVGVVENVAEGDLTDAPKPARYFLAGTVSWFAPQASFVIRAKRAQDAAALLDRARVTMQKVAPAFGLQATMSMSGIVDRAVGPARQILALLGLLAGLAVLLGTIGIYGVISHFAMRRQRDWAIRIALGAPGRRVIGQIVGQAVVLVGAGIVIGAAGTAALGHLLGTFLYRVSALDPLAFLAASAGLLVIGAAAAFIPARRAGAADPIMALREQ